jgi:hypothetical protein
MFGCGYAGVHVARPDSTEALAAAVEDASVTCIKLAPVVYSLTSTLTAGGSHAVHASVVGSLAGRRPLAIVAEKGQATLDGGGGITVLRNAGADVTLANLVLRNGGPYKNGFGAGIHALGYGTMAVHNCTFENHNAHLGSALYNQAGTIEMHNCIFRNNTAAAVGLQHASHLLHRVPTQ